jgi:hypothetical protein
MQPGRRLHCLAGDSGAELSQRVLKARSRLRGMRVGLGLSSVGGLSGGAPEEGKRRAIIYVGRVLPSSEAAKCRSAILRVGRLILKVGKKP